MKIGLKQVDGKWSNIALMKLSAWHKAQGDTVEWFSPLFEPYDRVYASKIFQDTPDDDYLPADTQRGGTGYGLRIKLPDEVEAMFPDYSICQGDYAIGFTTRGCCRDCEFCVVPQKEGRLKVVGDLYSFWSGQREVRLMDSNLTAAPMAHFEKIMEQLRAEKVKVDISQGLDLRLLRAEHLKAMLGIRFCEQLRFAWDDPAEENKVRDGLELVREVYRNGSRRLRVTVYVLIGYNTTPEEDIKRVEILREIGADPFVMVYNRADNYQRRFARWVNHKAIFKSVAWDSYDKTVAQ